MKVLKRAWLLATFRPWVCRVTRRHSLVPRIPLCFRCQQEWDEWGDIPAARK